MIWSTKSVNFSTSSFPFLACSMYLVSPLKKLPSPPSISSLTATNSLFAFTATA